MTIFDGDLIEREGRTFRVNIEYDDDADPPWENDCGSGIISDWTARDKRPGERVLLIDRHLKRYYDFAATVKKARADGWDSAPYNTGTPGERAVRAVEANFEFMRKWCAGQWWYVGVIVTDVTDDEHAPSDYGHACWRVESNDYAGIETIAEENIQEILWETAGQRAEEAAEQAKREQFDAELVPGAYDASQALLQAVRTCAELGLVPEVDRLPRKPLAMGHFTLAVNVRLSRETYNKERS